MSNAASAYSWFFRRGGWRIADSASGVKASPVLRMLQNRALASVEERRAQTDELLRAILLSARQSPYYREILRPLTSSSRMVSPRSVLAEIPVLTKDQLRRHPEAFISPSLKEKPNRIQTAGSTGQPLRAYLDPIASATCSAGMFFGRSWWGIPPGAPSVNIWGHSKYLSTSWRDSLRLRKRRLMDSAMNRRVFPAYDLSRERLDDFIALVRRFRPVYLVGYASALHAAARHVIDRGEVLPPLLGVVSTGEMLYDWQASTLRQAFGCPVIVEYGLCEGGVVAYSHPSGASYVMDAYLHLELLDEHDQPVQPGEIGRIVITPLLAHGVPMLRYDTGDLAQEVEQRSDGPTGRIIGQIQGRAYDLIVAADGARLPGVLFTHAMKYIEEVGRYQIVQREPGRLTVFYEAPAPLDPAGEERARQRIRAAVDRPIEVTFRHEARLSTEKSGKFRWIKSELPEERMGGLTASSATHISS